jgi:hypothetical protein
VLLGNGNGTFQPAINYPSGGIVPGALAAVDLNRDGTPDLLVTNGGCFQCQGTVVTVLIGNGDGSFQAPVNDNLGTGAIGPQWVAAGDVDGDGSADAVVLSGCAFGGDCLGVISVLPGNGGGLQAATAYNWFSSNLGYEPNTVVVADLNNDGKPDIVIASWNSVGVMLNQTPRAATATDLFSQRNPSAYGQAVTFTASVVTPFAPGTPTGSVTFTDGATTLGIAPLVSTLATLTIPNLPIGSHSVVATYSSDSNFRASVSAPLIQVVKPATTITVASSANPSSQSQSVTFTATVTAQFGGTLSGSVTFNDGNTILGTAALSGNTASFSTSNLAVGTHFITAVYAGDAGNMGSTSAGLSQTVNAATQVVVDTAPSGLTIVVDSVTYTAPQTFSWAPGSAHTIATVSPQTSSFRYLFMNWSDGGAAAHTVNTPSSATTYTANFVAAGQTVPSRLLAWGSNSNGQLGYVDPANFTPDYVVSLYAGSGVTRLAAGATHKAAV